MRYQHSPLWPLMPEMVKMRRNGASLEELGRMHGVTTEFIRQLLNVYLGAEEAKKLTDSRKLSKIAENRRRREYAQLAELLRRCATAKPCPVCGAWVLRTGRTCSAECAAYLRCNRYRVSTEDRLKHHVYQAKTYLRKPEKYSASKVRWATALLNGETWPSLLGKKPDHGLLPDRVVEHAGVDHPRFGRPAERRPTDGDSQAVIGGYQMTS